MKKTFLVLMAASVLAACNQASSSTANGKTDSGSVVSATALPVIKFDRETHDFGKIKSGDVVKYDFKFTNTGKSPLIITNATATCGCTKPDYPKTPVAPGENGVIHVEFNSTGKMGLQDKQITITANTNPAESRVHLIGDVLTQSN